VKINLNNKERLNLPSTYNRLIQLFNIDDLNNF
jgi:hypothetical protein